MRVVIAVVLAHRPSRQETDRIHLADRIKGTSLPVAIEVGDLSLHDHVPLW